MEPQSERPGWTFLTNHAHVLLCLSQNPELRQRDLSHAVGITIGAVQRIIDDLEEGGYLSREKIGRRNHYRTHPMHHLRHPLEAHHTVQDLLSALGPEASGTPDPR